MKLFSSSGTASGLRSESFRIDALFTGVKIETALEDFRDASPIGAPLAPIGSQEVWAAGVTYFRSREARMEESEKEADVYDRVPQALKARRIPTKTNLFMARLIPSKEREKQRITIPNADS